MKDDYKNISSIYVEFKRYEQEIFLGVYETVVKPQAPIIIETKVLIGENEIHHMIKYYQKAILNSLYFKDKEMMLEYHRWLYRVYFYRSIDLDFFSFLLMSFQEVSQLYIDKKLSSVFDETVEYVLQEHENLKHESSKKQVLIDYEKESSEFAKLLTQGDTKASYEFCKNASKNLEDFIVFYDDIVRNAMKKIGFMWEVGEVSIAKEHIASNVLNDILMQRLDEYEEQKQKDTHIFLSSAPNELHGLAINIASKVLQNYGYRVTNIGISLPVDEIKKAIMEFKPDIVILSASLQTSILDLAYLIDELNKDRVIFVKPIKIGIAGNAFERIVHPTRTLRADFYVNGLKRLFEMLT